MEYREHTCPPNYHARIILANDEAYWIFLYLPVRFVTVALYKLPDEAENQPNQRGFKIRRANLQQNICTALITAIYIQYDGILVRDFKWDQVQDIILHNPDDPRTCCQLISS